MHLSNLGFRPIACEETLAEAFSVLGRMALELRLGFDPSAVLQAYLRSVSIIIVPRIKHRAFTKINRSDIHVASAALEYHAWLLSGDLKLLAECENEGVPARAPWDVIFEASFKNGQDPPIEYLLRFAGLNRTKGCLFGKVIPGTWAGMKIPQIFTICEIENLGSLYYDANSSEWVFSSVFGSAVRVSCAILPDQHWIVLATFNAEKDQGLMLRASRPGGQTYSGTSKVVSAVKAGAPGQITFGHSVNGTAHWNGHLARVVIGSDQISKETWKSVVTVPGLAPDPASGDALRAALKTVTIRPRKIVLPSGSWWHQAWI